MCETKKPKKKKAFGPPNSRRIWRLHIFLAYCNLLLAMLPVILGICICVVLCSLSFLADYLYSGGRFGGIFGRKITQAEVALANACIGKSIAECKAILHGSKLKYNIYPVNAYDLRKRKDLEVFLLQNNGIVTEVMWNAEQIQVAD